MRGNHIQKPAQAGGMMRLDQALVARQLAESREKARRLIAAGKVSIDGQIVYKPACAVKAASLITLAEEERFVSRGGLKLLGAFEIFGITAAGKICLDIGASTGGFTDCLLQYGAAKVMAVDVGKGQLHWRLRQDARVVVLEGINARYLKPADLPDTPELAVVDVAFISLTKIMPALDGVLPSGGEIVTLIKPQFEAGRREVGRGGVVRDQAVREKVIADIRKFGEEKLGWQWKGVCVSPLAGPAGNVEFLAWWKKP